jgi:hypothetical protein
MTNLFERQSQEIVPRGNRDRDAQRTLAVVQGSDLQAAPAEAQQEVFDLVEGLNSG